MALLSVNIDHVATIRQARYRPGAGSGNEYGEPDAVRAAHEVEMGGGDGITVHLREDRRHIVDRDVELLRPLVRVKFNLEMAATDEMIAIATRVKPHSAMLVPEGRHEVTTEGGLDVAGQAARMRDVVARLREAGCLVSAFIDADARQVEACAHAGFDVCEVHTGPYAAAFLACGGDFRVERLRAAYAEIGDTGGRIRAAGMRFNAGHALNYANVGPIAHLPGVAELHIGHAIVSRAIFVGLRRAVRDMKQAMRSRGWAADVGGLSWD
ncbi:MAG: pyridoxine 5'-phosphate synthase [Planctomycetota bacterium]|nr:pyridoxine 5'-phosphate synthase [Planctomycetota bacterium]